MNDVFYFIKQKTAYEMRISDWSSDVCSSDLAARSRSGPMAEGDTGMNSARERLWRRLKIIAREQRLYVTGGCAGYNRADFHHSRRRTGRRDRDRDHRRGDGATDRTGRH